MPPGELPNCLKSRRLILLAAFLIASCAIPKNGSAQSGGDAAQNVSLMKMTDPVERSFTLQMPKGWRNEAYLVRTYEQVRPVAKLSSHARNNRTKRALWEYDSIHRSLYLLTYLDSLSIRRNVQKAVNRGENYHQLRRAVSFASFGKLRFKTEYEQDLWSECSQLIANIIIFYNASILSRFTRAPGTKR